MSSISSLVRKYVSHRLPSSSDTEYEAGEDEEADMVERSDGSIDSDHDDIEDLNPSGQSVTNQLSLPGDHTATPTEYQMALPQQYPQPLALAHQQFQVPAPEQYQVLAPQQYQVPAPYQYQVLAPHQYQMPPPQQSQLPYMQPQPQYHQQPKQTLLDQHPTGESKDRAVAEAYAGAFALLHTGSSRLPSQPNIVRDGSLAPWGAAWLVALAPLHLGESTCGERTQGVIRLKNISPTLGDTA
ncbi:hypothetical protein BDR07DRAFT_1490271 [Suillus spraguei]|nr:hypothetical protein BDR07DRAFT_1490271 [Suillus spraguei]